MDSVFLRRHGLLNKNLSARSYELLVRKALEAPKITWAIAICGNLSENGPHRLMFIQILGPQVVELFGKIRKHCFFGGAKTLRVAFEISKAHVILPTPTLCY